MADIDNVWEAKGFLEEVCSGNICSSCPLFGGCGRDCIYLEITKIWATWGRNDV